MSEGLFNFVIGWTIMFAPLLYTDLKNNRYKGSLDVLWGFQMFLTNTFLIPYMAIRLNKPDVEDNPRKPSQLGTFMIQGADIVGLTGGFVSLISILWGLFARAEGDFGSVSQRWDFLLSYLGSERLAYAFIWDIVLYTIFQPWLIGDNLANVQENKVDIVKYLSDIGYATVERKNKTVHMAFPLSMSLFIFSFLCMLLAIEGSHITSTSGLVKEDPKPTVWPEQFHSLLVMNNTKTKELQVADLWYDWPNKRNLHLIQSQLGKKLYDVEYDNHTSFFFTRDDTRECRTVEVEVGILVPDWLHGANYLGQQEVDGFLCNVWEKVEFIWYYEDVVSKRPVQWIFYTGRAVHVMTFEVGAVLKDSEWQAPVYCFDNEETSKIGHSQRILRPLSRSSV